MKKIIVCYLLFVGALTEIPAQSSSPVPDEERYTAILKKLGAGEKVESADISWALAYEAGKKKTGTANNPGNSHKSDEAPNTPEETRMASARTQIGRYYTYSIKAQKNIFGNTVNEDAGEYALRIKGISSKSTGTKIIYDIRYTRTDKFSCNAISGELEADLLTKVNGDIFYRKSDGRGTCSYCNGAGTKTVNFSHTNDYEHTLGKKVTYSGSSTVSCKECSGSGKTKYLDYKLSCL